MPEPATAPPGLVRRPSGLRLVRFRYGHFTEGIVRSAKAGGVYATFKYEFEADGAGYIAFMDYAAEMEAFRNEGDRIPVLFDPEDPKRSCFVYR